VRSSISPAAAAIISSRFPAANIADSLTGPKLKRPTQGGGGVRQRHAGRILAAGAGSDRFATWCARLQPRPLVPALQPQSRTWRCCMRSAECVANRADVASLDGDGDRCGVVDDEGEEISPTSRVMLARRMSSLPKGAKFVST